jgi:hypothetical protein
MRLADLQKPEPIGDADVDAIICARSEDLAEKSAEASGVILVVHDFRVHYFRMKNVTLSADENLIEKARQIARSQRKTLNSAFREWLEQFTASDGNLANYDALMKSLGHVKAGRHFSRDELNER